MDLPPSYGTNRLFGRKNRPRLLQSSGTAGLESPFKGFTFGGALVNSSAVITPIPMSQQLQMIPFTPTMAAYLESPELSDVTLKSKEGDCIPAHRVVLASSSDVFKTMFASDMREKAQGVVEINDIGTKALKVMLKFLYIGAFKDEINNFVEYDLDIFLELVRAGDKYNLPIMMKQGGVGLSLRVTKDNAMEVFLELKNYGEEMKETRSQIADFIEKNVRDMV